MPTTLSQQYARAREPNFMLLVEAALDEILPDVIGEAVGAVVPVQAAAAPFTVTLTAEMVRKRHEWASAILNSPERRAHWVRTLSCLSAGENAIRSIDVPAMPSDVQIKITVQRLINDCAGVKNGD